MIDWRAVVGFLVIAAVVGLLYAGLLTAGEEMEADGARAAAAESNDALRPEAERAGGG